MGKSLKVLTLFDSHSAKPRGHDFAEEFEKDEWKSERHVVEGLRSLGHDVRMLGLFDDVALLIEDVKEFAPDVVFNLMEEFHQDPCLVANVAAVLEMLGVAYTGSTPLGLRLCKDKALAKMILVHHGVPTPPFQVFERDRVIKRSSGVKLPIVVKPKVEDASYGIAKASVVEDDEALEERVRFVHESTGQAALAEEYVDGREVYVSILGAHRLRVFPLREVKFGQLAEGDNLPIATYKVKWDAAYRKKRGIEYVYVEDMEEALVKKIEDISRASYRALELGGYARVDVRMDQESRPYVLEVNPNPYLARDEDYAQSAERGGLPWEKLLQAIINEAVE
ncbi:MAG: ATP-grasp domain-containing protein [Elusimicrobiota bacterium]